MRRGAACVRSFTRRGAACVRACTRALTTVARGQVGRERCSEAVAVLAPPRCPRCRIAAACHESASIYGGRARRTRTHTRAQRIEAREQVCNMLLSLQREPALNVLSKLPRLLECARSHQKAAHAARLRQLTRGTRAALAAPTHARTCARTCACARGACCGRDRSTCSSVSACRRDDTVGCPSSGTPCILASACILP